VKIEEEIKQKHFHTAREKALINLIFTHNWLQNNFRSLFKAKDITIQQYNVLRILRGKHPDFVNPNYVKEVMLDKNPDLTRLCDRLVSSGLITRCVDPENKRKVNLRITDQGLKLLQEFDPLMEKLNQTMVHLSEEESSHLSDLLDKLRG
jgi:DNA-binding MarR family transcriptional regulator